MECTDTGSHTAVRLPHLSTDLALELDEAIGGVQHYGHGNGQIVLNMVNGFVNAIEFTMRRHRKGGKTPKSA